MALDIMELEVGMTLRGASGLLYTVQSVDRADGSFTTSRYPGRVYVADRCAMNIVLSPMRKAQPDKQAVLMKKAPPPPDIHVQYASFQDTVKRLLAGTNVAYCSDICLKDNTFMLKLEALKESRTMFLQPTDTEAIWHAHVSAMLNCMAHDAALKLLKK